ncbi:MAG: hypothetical protein KDK99_05015 [Verrucomicrobiales bacterium]|nr:hypothetical protein [Verrucomicrobiales bacterium]
MKKSLLLALLAVAASTHAADELTIETIMKDAMKGDTSLYKRVSNGSASKDDAKRFLAYAEALTKQTPPKGDEASWKRKTGELAKAAKAASFGTKQGQLALQRAGNCKSCHSAHKED